MSTISAFCRVAKRAPLVLVVALTGCGPNCDGRQLSDNGQYWVEPSVYDLLGSESRRVLVGTEFWFHVIEVVEGEIDEDQGGILCVGQAGSGVLDEYEPDLFRVTAAGDGAVELLAPSIACPGNTDLLADLGPDRYTIIGVDADQVTARWVSQADALVGYDWTEPGPRGVFPDEFDAPLDEVSLVIGSSFSAAPVLLQPAIGERVEVRYSAEQVIADPELMALALPDDNVEHVVPPGLDLEPVLEIAGHEFALPRIRSVDATQITELELVAAYARQDAGEREWGTPRYVVALAHDASGQRVLGPEVEWTLTQGHLGLTRFGERLRVSDICSSRPKHARSDSATIEARIGEVVTSIDLEWTALPGDERNYDHEMCEQAGCSCAVDSGGRDSVFAVFALLGFGAWLRRR